MLKFLQVWGMKGEVSWGVVGRGGGDTFGAWSV